MKNEVIEKQLKRLEAKVDKLINMMSPPKDRDEEREERIDKKIKGIFGHAVPEEKRKVKIEEVFVFKPIDRDKVKIKPEDLELNMDDYKLWKMFNNPEERRNRTTDIHFTDNPDLNDEERLEVHKRNAIKMKENLIKQIKQNPNLFGGV